MTKYKAIDITKILRLLLIVFILTKPDLLRAQNNSVRIQSIDGTYELLKRVMADSTVIEPPAIKALYNLTNGQFNFNLFIKKKDGTMSSESTIGHYTFTNNQYCEWIDYTIRNNLDSAGMTYNAPIVTKHCTPVTWNKSGFSYSPPGESVDVIFRSDGFTAKIAGEFIDYWRKIK